VRIGKPPRIFRSTSSHRQYRKLGLGDRACVCSEAGRHGKTCCRNNFWLRRARPNSRVRNRLDEAKAPVAVMLKMHPTMNILEAEAFYAMFCFEHIRTARKCAARCAWRRCRNRAAELERVASPATLSSTACVQVYIILYITVISCSPARPRGASTGVGRAEAEIFLLATA
jgi:hypothetical protein